MAIRWHHPSILIGIGSRAVLTRAQSALRKWIRAEGQRVETVRPGETNSDIPLTLSRRKLRDETVYFVDRLTGGGEPALRALNLRREYLVEKKIRVVFWLTEAEERRLAERAPDFWAFRHRVIYLGQELD
jgi:hypothetical protein